MTSTQEEAATYGHGFQHGNEERNNNANCGLYHLVEAATALTQLVRTVQSPPSTQVDQQSTHAVSDDDEPACLSSVETCKQCQNVSLCNLCTCSTKKGQTQSPSETCTQTQTQTQEMSCPNSSSSSTCLNSNMNKSRETNSSTGTSMSSTVINGKEIFPQRLMKILSQPSISEIVTWLPHGRSFVIIRPDVFADKILPKYFPESCASTSSSIGSSMSAPKKAAGPKSAALASTACKYPSFTRKLNRWGFRQVSRGPDAGAFHHKFFQRDDPDLCLKMVCQKSRRPKTATGNANVNANVNANGTFTVTVAQSQHTSVASSCVDSTDKKRKSTTTSAAACEGFNMAAISIPTPASIAATCSTFVSTDDLKNQASATGTCTSTGTGTGLPPKKRKLTNHVSCNVSAGATASNGNNSPSLGIPLSMYVSPQAMRPSTPSSTSHSPVLSTSTSTIASPETRTSPISCVSKVNRTPLNHFASSSAANSFAQLPLEGYRQTRQTPDSATIAAADSSATVHGTNNANDTYLSARALLQHNMAISAAMQAAVASAAQAQAQVGSAMPLLQINGVNALGSFAAPTTNTCSPSQQTQPPTPSLPSVVTTSTTASSPRSLKGTPSVSPTPTLQATTDAQARAESAKTMLYKAYLEALIS